MSQGEIVGDNMEQREQWVADRNIHLICPECKAHPPNIVEEFAAGDLVCADCGVVLGERMVDTRPEWGTFNDENNNGDPRRIGQAAGIDGEQLHSVVAMDKTAVSKDLNRTQQKLTGSSRDHRQRRLRSNIKDICGSARLNEKVAEFAEDLWLKAQKKGFKPKDHASVQAACVFIACRKSKASRTLKEIAEMFGVKPSKLGHAFKRLEAFLRESTRSKTTLVGGAITQQEQYAGATATPVREHIDRFTEKLGLPYQVVSKTKECADALSLHGGLETRTPQLVAGTALYIISHLMGHPRSTTDIGAAVNLGGRTIRAGYRLAYPRREKWLKSEWLGGDGSLDLLPKIRDADEGGKDPAGMGAAESSES